MLMNVNYMGSVFATRAVIGQMKIRNHGRVVFISSQAGQMGLFGFSAYSASKFALRGLAESLQMEASNIILSTSYKTIFILNCKVSKVQLSRTNVFSVVLQT